ncbi:MAG: proprotein convertase P-domain-containing protein [Ardenticatenaceae bacterium]|nr:proprotein convertase P-domain-containing protein [Ardenticatenaceae bacterium]
MIRATGPAPETAVRQQAVQQVFAPGRTSASGDARDDELGNDISYVHGAPVAPAEVDLRTLPSRAADTDLLQQRYLAGEFDMDENEGPVSPAVFDNLVQESLAQGVDKSVQNYEGSPTILALNSGASFKSIDYTQSQQGVPPDPDITVGTGQIIIGVNTSFQVFDKAGNSLVGPTLFSDFWGANCGTGSSVVMFDPYLDYDEKENRYILGITAYDPNVNGGDNGYACIAVSKTDNAAGQYWLYSFDGNPGTGTDYFFDYPHLGVGQNALYLSANMFGASFVRNHVFAFDKFAMYNGQSANNVKINVGSNNFTLQPAKMHGYTSGGWPSNTSEPHYFVDAQYGNNQNTLTVWKFSDPFGTPSLTQAGTVTVNSYSLSVAQPQLGGSNIQGNDNRLLDVKYWGGKLYAVHHIGCNPGSGTVNCIRWYIIDISSGTPVLSDQGTFSSNGEYRSFPAIAPNACGDLLVGYTKTSSSIYPSVYVAGREAGDTSGQLKNETLVHAGEAYYTAYDSVPRRWGDYTGMGIDPDGVTFWYVGEYSRNQATARWSTWVSAFAWSGCNVGPTPTPGPTATATNTPLPTNTPGPISCSVYNSTDVPKTISTSGTPTVNSVLNVATSGTIADVNVLNLNGTHTWINDLDFNLSSPAGTNVQIMARSCSSEDNFNLNLDDAASGTWPCPPTGGGTYPPSNPLSAFNGQNSAGTWTLTIHDNANLDGGSLNGWSLEICVEGSGPTPTNTPVPPTATNTPVPGPTNTPTNTPVPPTATNTPVPPTATNTPVPGGSDVIYMSSTTNGSVGGVSFNDEDIIAYDTGTGIWSMYFDGSDVGVSTDVNAFTLLSDGSILMSFDSTTTAGAAGSVDDSDIVQFSPTSLGDNTAGTFSFFFDGSDVGLTTSGEDIDAMSVSTDGKLVISTLGSFSVTGASGGDEDILIFTASSFGSTTSGSWALYFDGSDVGLNDSTSEDIYGVSIDTNGDLYLTTAGTFSVTGVSGDGADIFICVPGSLGSTTSCTFSMYWDGSVNGFGGEIMDAVEIVR